MLEIKYLVKKLSVKNFYRMIYGIQYYKKKVKCYMLIVLLFSLVLNNKFVTYAYQQTNMQNLNESDITKGYEVESKVQNTLDNFNILQFVKPYVGAIGTILVEILGAFLGFLSAIAFANRSNKKQREELNDSLYYELKTIYNELDDRLKDEDIGDYYRYLTPLWEISLSSGTLTLVTNSLIYNKYIKIYSKIQYAQDLEREYLHTKLFAKTEDLTGFANRYINTIDKERQNEAKSIRDEIYQNILKEIDKNIIKETDKCRE